MHGIVRICGGSISWILLVPLITPTSLHPQQIMKQYSIHLLYSPTNA